MRIKRVIFSDFLLRICGVGEILFLKHVLARHEDTADDGVAQHVIESMNLRWSVIRS